MHSGDLTASFVDHPQGIPLLRFKVSKMKPTAPHRSQYHISLHHLYVQTYFNTSLEEKDVITPLVGGILILMPIKESKEGQICHKKKIEVVWRI